MRAWHFLKANMRAGEGREKAWVEGEERSKRGRLELCKRGYHSSPTPWDALFYAPGPVLCLVEVSEPEASEAASGTTGAKAVSRTRKLIKAVNIERELRLFACDCAEAAIESLKQAGGTPDARSLAAIETARRFAVGEASAEELDAARDAAWDAALAAAWATARDAAWAAAWAAARATARDAAWAAAWAAARDAAWGAARAAFGRRFNEITEALFAEVPV